jgi:hypothetical protein
MLQFKEIDMVGFTKTSPKNYCHSLTQLPAIFFLMIGTKKKCTITAANNPPHMLATNAPHSGILSRYSTATK